MVNHVVEWWGDAINSNGGKAQTLAGDREFGRVGGRLRGNMWAKDVDCDCNYNQKLCQLWAVKTVRSAP